MWPTRTASGAAPTGPRRCPRVQSRGACRRAYTLDRGRAHTRQTHAKAEGAGRNYLIQHSAGSGARRGGRSVHHRGHSPEIHSILTGQIHWKPRFQGDFMDQEF